MQYAKLNNYKIEGKLPLLESKMPHLDKFKGASAPLVTNQGSKGSVLGYIPKMHLPDFEGGVYHTLLTTCVLS